MRMRAATIVAVLSGAGAAAFAAACQNTSATGSATSSSSAASAGAGAGSASSATTGSSMGGSGTGGGANVQSFTPKGCQFSIAPRPEYMDFQIAAETSAATPNIRRVRLGLGGNVVAGAGYADPSTTIGFAWQTDDGTFAADVAWGTDPDPSKWSSSDRTSGVTWLTPEGMLNGDGPERMHEAYACGLKPATTYYYRVGGGASGSEVWSDVETFTTAPSDPGAKVTIALTGDSRGEQQNAWQLLQRRVKMKGVTLQMFSGDMINLAPDQGEWQEWLDNAWRDSDKSYLTLGQTLTLAAHGNHDNHTPLFFGNLVLPQDPKHYPKYGELFYSVDVGPVHIVVVDDAYIVDPTADPDFKTEFDPWINQDLAAANANRSKVPWIIAMHHHPEYSSSAHGMDADVLMGRDYFEPIWEKYHVDMVVAGHDHDYERSKPLTGPADAPTVHQNFSDGTVYLVCAGSGADGYSAGTSAFTEISHDFTSGSAIGLYSFLTIDKSNLAIEAHELKLDASDPIFDTVTITK